MIYLALYRGRKTLRRPYDLIARTADGLTRMLTRGPYSHCEIALLSGSPHTDTTGCLKADDLAANGAGYLKEKEHSATGYLKDNTAPVYRCYSASIRDGGVRCKTMPLPADQWDVIALGDEPHLHAALHAHYAATQGQAYDWIGALGIVLRTRQYDGKWFCSEWCGHVLGLPESWRFSPNDLAAIVRRGRQT